jgi:hypothetical protein
MSKNEVMAAAKLIAPFISIRLSGLLLVSFLACKEDDSDFTFSAVL